MKKLAIGAGLTLLVLAGCSNEEDVAEVSAEAKLIDSMQTQLLTMQNNLTKTNNELTRTQVKLYELEASINKPKVTGAQLVNAAELYVRTGPGVEHPPVAVALYNAPIEVVDSSGTWYKVRIPASKLTAKDEEKLITYADKAGTKFKLYKNQKDAFEKLNKTGELYVHGHFITQSEDKIVAQTELPANPKKPFVYGLTFFDFATKDIMEKKLWNALSGDLQTKGFDGIEVVNIDRETFADDLKAGKYDAVENAPGDFVIANRDLDNPALIAFAKTVDETTRNDHYRGLIIVNKNSGINSFDDLTGRKIATGKEYSESGFKYQNHYLKNAEGIDISKEATLIQDYSHQEILFVVATGKLDAGFVGDFVLTDPYHELEYGASQVGIELTNEAQLNELRDQVITIPYNGSMNAIPNNPHSLRADLAEDSAFVEKLHKVVELIYADNKEGFDLTSATNKEYEFLLEIQTMEE